MRGLIFDPFAGISGDMILGALVDVGLEPDWLESFVASLGLGPVPVVFERADRSGIACARVRFELPPQRSHRHLSDVLRIVEGSSAAPQVKARAGAAFQRLAEAEAAVHGVAVEAVHFHEVGALDAILDVLCAMAAVAELGIEIFATRPVTVGRGWIEIEHGRFPTPAPATLKLLEGLPVRDPGFEGECSTPTGAAVLATLVEGRSAPSEMMVLGSGYGAGQRNTADRPNCLRVILAELDTRKGEALFVVQADLDDLSPEYVPPAQDALRQAGAVDTVVSGVGMKKGRPGVRLEALVSEARLDAVLDALFRNTSTIGARYWPVVRPALPRVEDVIEWRGQRVTRKRVRLPGGGERSKPEYDDVVRAARALGMEPYRVRTALEGDGLADRERTR